MSEKLSPYDQHWADWEARFASHRKSLAPSDVTSSAMPFEEDELAVPVTVIARKPVSTPPKK